MNSGLRGSAILAALLLIGDAQAIELGQIDDFQDGTTMGWEEGIPTPNAPSNIPDGGPGGIGDAYVENRSAGGVGPGSRQIMFNQAQWTGDYIGVGVDGISLDLANFGNTTLYIRLAIEGQSGGQFGSTLPFELPPDGQWYRASFGLDDTSLSFIDGLDDLTAVLSNVVELRILSAESDPAWRGDAIDATLGVDNISAEGGESFTLAAPVPGVAGVLNTWTATGATPGGFVLLFIGLGPGSSPFPFPQCPGLTIDIQTSFFFGFSRADVASVAGIDKIVPLVASGRNIRSQVVDLQTCSTSNVDITQFQ